MMKPSCSGNAVALTVVAMLLACTSRVYAESNSGVEIGRLQICSASATAQSEVEIPADGKYVIAAEKVGLPEAVVITQTDFSTASDSGPQAQNNNGLKDRFSLENRNGKVVVHLKFNGLPCLYLNAAAPVLKGSNLTLSGTHVMPDWISGGKGAQIEGLSYRYFNSVDQTYYVASEVGRSLSFAVHGMQTGSLLNHDRVQKVAVSNPEVLNLLPLAFKAKLEQLNQFDINLIDAEKLKIDIQNFNLQSSSGVAELVAQFRSTVQPPPHSRLILAVPKRGDVRMEFSNTTLVGNKLEGLGFYRDASLSTSSDTDREVIVPIDAFINFQSVVIDLDTATLVATQSYADGRLFFSSVYPETDLADSITDHKKLVALKRAVNMGVSKVMNGMFTVK